MTHDKIEYCCRVTKDVHDIYHAKFQDFPNLTAKGKSWHEVLTEAENALIIHIANLRVNNIELPIPTSYDETRAGSRSDYISLITI